MRVRPARPERARDARVEAGSELRLLRLRRLRAGVGLEQLRDEGAVGDRRRRLEVDAAGREERPRPVVVGHAARLEGGDDVLARDEGALGRAPAWLGLRSGLGLGRGLGLGSGLRLRLGLGLGLLLGLGSVPKSVEKEPSDARRLCSRLASSACCRLASLACFASRACALSWLWELSKPAASSSVPRGAGVTSASAGAARRACAHASASASACPAPPPLGPADLARPGPRLVAVGPLLPPLGGAPPMMASLKGSTLPRSRSRTCCSSDGGITASTNSSYETAPSPLASIVRATASRCSRLHAPRR